MTENPYDYPVVAPIDKISWVMETILAAVEETFQGYGIELPSSRYLTLSTPVHDCEQVTVTNIQAYIGPPGDQAGTPMQCDGPRSGVFQVEIVRCVPQPKGNLRKGESYILDPEEMLNYVRLRSQDLWALLDSAGLLPDYNAIIADVSIGEMQGIYQGAILNLVVQL